MQPTRNQKKRNGTGQNIPERGVFGDCVSCLAPKIPGKPIARERRANGRVGTTFNFRCEKCGATWPEIRYEVRPYAKEWAKNAE